MVINIRINMVMIRTQSCWKQKQPTDSAFELIIRNPSLLENTACVIVTDKGAVRAETKLSCCWTLSSIEGQAWDGVSR